MALVAIGAGAGVAAVASAQGRSSDSTALARAHGGFGMGHGGPGRGIHGTVSAINGDTLTITNADGTSYTVAAGSAEVSKVATISVSDIKVGDTALVHGTVSGTTVTATHIMDGKLPKPNAPPAAQTQ